MSFTSSIRPRDHFTPRRGWLNDPNGLVHLDGEFHLYFQHWPDEIVHGPMSWGHAVSDDLLDWTELPVALAATETEHMWSGSVVHDVANTSGLGGPGTGPLVATYTSFAPTTKVQTQSVAWSIDRGRTWQPYAGNPVLDIGSTAFRDPKVLRHDDGWLMVLVLADARTVETYRSTDLLHWEHASSFGPAGSVEGVWECPDLLRVPIEGTDATAVVLLVSVLSGPSLPRNPPIRFSASASQARSDSALYPAASPAFTDQTMHERWPFASSVSGRIAKGPLG